jgi:formylglycine-generating enzyme required for sulfatase activity
VIEHFQADKPQVEMGSEVLLNAAFGNGTGRVDHDGGALESSGVVKVAPMATTTYVLTVTNERGETAKRQATVVVNPGLAVTVEGYEGAAGEVTVTGPEGFSRTMVASGLLTGLKKGDYSVKAAPAKRGELTLHPWCPEQKVTVETGTPVKVTYPAPTLQVMLPGQVPMDFVLIPAGDFIMGNDHPADPRLPPNPSPTHHVDIPKAFYFAKYPTTVAQWEAIAGPAGQAGVAADDAVGGITYEALQANYLPELNRRIPGHSFRLPSEAEWEYACRAGTTTAYYHGPDPLKVWEYAWSIDAYQAGPHPVGKKRPNRWGLHDLTGLVFQLCEDLAHDGYAGAPEDGSPWLDPGPSALEGRRILRGYPPVSIPGESLLGGSAERHARGEQVVDEYVGFRLVAPEEEGQIAAPGAPQWNLFERMN